MKDFAKLYRIANVGQVLVCLMENDNGDPVCRIRIPDYEGLYLTMDYAMNKYTDYDKAEQFAQDFFDNVTADNIQMAIKPLVVAKQRMIN